MEPHEERPQTIQPYNAFPITSSQPEPPKHKKSPLRLISIILGGVFVIAVISAIVLSGGKDAKKALPTQNSAQNSSQTPGKAAAIDVENVSNSISQSLGSLSDEQDFLPTQLDDKTLGL